MLKISKLIPPIEVSLQLSKLFQQEGESTLLEAPKEDVQEDIKGEKESSQTIQEVTTCDSQSQTDLSEELIAALAKTKEDSREPETSVDNAEISVQTSNLPLIDSSCQTEVSAEPTIEIDNNKRPITEGEEEVDTSVKSPQKTEGITIETQTAPFDVNEQAVQTEVIEFFERL